MAIVLAFAAVAVRGVDGDEATGATVAVAAAAAAVAAAAAAAAALVTLLVCDTVSEDGALMLDDVTPMTPILRLEVRSKEEMRVGNKESSRWTRRRGRGTILLGNEFTRFMIAVFVLF